MRYRSVFLAVSMALALAGSASAAGTLDSILPDIRAQHPGRLSDAEPWTDAGGNVHYRIKWLTPEGRILYFEADARTGRYWATNGEGSRWQGGQDWHGGNRNRDDGPPPDDSSARRSHWNGDGDGGTAGDWHRSGGGDWRGGSDGGRNGGSWGDRGGWRGGGGESGGDNDGHRRHGG
jgi:hypothetical protein